MFLVNGKGVLERRSALGGQAHDERSSILAGHFLADQRIGEKPLHQSRYVTAGHLEILRQLSERQSFLVTIELRQDVELGHRKPELGVEHRIQRRKDVAMQRQDLQPEPRLLLSKNRDSVVLECYRHRKTFVEQQDRKSTRLNSSHQIISYAVFCL